jgi:hypothetical protein
MIGRDGSSLHRLRLNAGVEGSYQKGGGGTAVHYLKNRALRTILPPEEEYYFLLVVINLTYNNYEYKVHPRAPIVVL